MRGDWEALTGLSVNPRDYSNAEAFARDYLVAEIASKVPPSVTGSTSEFLQATAMDKFMASELTCQAVNIGLPWVDSTAFRLKHGHGLREVFCLARDKIRSLLGKFDIDEWQHAFGFGPGASTRLNRSKSDLYYKFGLKPDTTHLNFAPSCLAVGYTDFLPVNLWARQLTEGTLTGSPYDVFNYVVGSKITTVPKNSKTDRVIAIEPCMNMYVQKGIGAMIRKRLLRVGVNLDDQKINQSLARDGSIDGSLATVDLKAASDCVSRRLVECLLPEDWYCMMNTVRSHRGVLPSGEIISFQKFSSMGNGFTFELESLIFWALAKSVAEYLKLKDRRLGIYGDDIIFPTQGVQMLMEALKVAGFEPNTKKTFFDGPFRESCGKHYFQGVDVTPFYVKKDIVHLQPLFVFVNNLRRFSSRISPEITAPDLFEIWKCCFLMIPRQLRRLRGPDGYGDGFIIGNFDEVRPQRANTAHHRYAGWEGWLVYSIDLLSLKPIRKSGRVSGSALLLKSFYRLDRQMLEEGDCSDGLAIRLERPDYKLREKVVVKWPWLGSPLV